MVMMATEDKYGKNITYANDIKVPPFHSKKKEKEKRGPILEVAQGKKEKRKSLIKQQTGGFASDLLKRLRE